MTKNGFFRRGLRLLGELLRGGSGGTWEWGGTDRRTPHGEHRRVRHWACSPAFQKGFVHIVEVVIVSLLTVVAVPFLLSPLKNQAGWDEARLSLTAKDILSSMDNISDGQESYLQNIMVKNSTELTSRMKEIFGPGKNVGFSLTTRGALRNEIRVGYNCTACDVAEVGGTLGTLLTPVEVNGRNITFAPFLFNFTNYQGYDIDVIIIFNNPSEAEPFKDTIKSHLAEGRGVVQFANLTLSDFPSTLQSEVFGMTSSGCAPSGVLPNQTFVNPDNPLLPNYDMQKIYYGVSNQDRDPSAIPPGHRFNRTPGTEWIEGSCVDVLNGEAQRVVTREDGGTRPSVIVNTSSPGRAVWMDYFEYSTQEQEDQRNLLRTAVIWAAQRDWLNIQKTVSGKETERAIYPVSQGEEFFEPYTVELTMWYVF